MDEVSFNLAREIFIAKNLGKTPLNRIFAFFKAHNQKETLIVKNGVRLITPIGVEKFFEEADRVYLKPQRGDVVIDAGAHYGFYTVQAARLVGNKGTVLAFEPCPVNYKGLLRNLQLNGIRNVRAFDVALGNACGQTKLYLGHSLSHSIAIIKSIYSITVGVIRIDDLNLEKVDLVKIDAEGAELDILKGAVKTLKRCKPRITIASYHYPNQARTIKDWVKQNLSYKVLIKSDSLTNNLYAHAKPA